MPAPSATLRSICENHERIIYRLKRRSTDYKYAPGAGCSCPLARAILLVTFDSELAFYLLTGK